MLTCQLSPFNLKFLGETWVGESLISLLGLFLMCVFCFGLISRIKKERVDNAATVRPVPRIGVGVFQRGDGGTWGA